MTIRKSGRVLYVRKGKKVESEGSCVMGRVMQSKLRKDFANGVNSLHMEERFTVIIITRYVGRQWFRKDGCKVQTNDTYEGVFKLWALQEARHRSDSFHWRRSPFLPAAAFGRNELEADLEMLQSKMLVWLNYYINIKAYPSHHKVNSDQTTTDIHVFIHYLQHTA
jgi:hypothetical protein